MFSYDVTALLLTELIKIIILVIAFISNIFLQIYLWLPNWTSGGNTFLFFQYIRFSKNQIIRVNNTLKIRLWYFRFEPSFLGYAFCLGNVIFFYLSHFNPSRPNPGRREKKTVKFLFSHFFVVPRLLEKHGTLRVH